MYLATGATGNIGGAVTAALTAQGLPVRALVRDPHRARLPEGATPAVADLNDPDTLTPWLDGVEAAFMLPGYPDMPALYARLRDAGVKHAVQLSGNSAGSGDTTNAVTAMMIDSETAVRESGSHGPYCAPAHPCPTPSAGSPTSAPATSYAPPGATSRWPASTPRTSPR